jgi:hypothetical protein
MVLISAYGSLVYWFPSEKLLDGLVTTQVAVASGKLSEDSAYGILIRVNQDVFVLEQSQAAKTVLMECYSEVLPIFIEESNFSLPAPNHFSQGTQPVLHDRSQAQQKSLLNNSEQKIFTLDHNHFAMNAKEPKKLLGSNKYEYQLKFRFNGKVIGSKIHPDCLEMIRLSGPHFAVLFAKSLVHLIYTAKLGAWCGVDLDYEILPDASLRVYGLKLEPHWQIV